MLLVFLLFVFFIVVLFLLVVLFLRIKYNKILKTYIGVEQDQTNKREKSLRKGTRFRDSFFCILTYAMKTLNCKPKYRYSERIWCRPMKALYMLHESLWVHTSFDNVGFEGLVCVVSSMFSGSVLSTSFSMVLLKPSGKGIDKDIPFRAECS